jgi:hypothetical protein
MSLEMRSGFDVMSTAEAERARVIARRAWESIVGEMVGFACVWFRGTGLESIEYVVIEHGALWSKNCRWRKSKLRYRIGEAKQVTTGRVGSRKDSKGISM